MFAPASHSAREASPWSTASALTIDPAQPLDLQRSLSPEHNEASINFSGRQGQNLSQRSQSSQSPRIVTIPQSNTCDQARLVISKIDEIFESMIKVLTQYDGEDGEIGERMLTIPYRNRNALQQPLRALTFPGKSVNEATKFTRMIRIMELSREALMSGRLITKRNIYYQNTELFKDQATVDKLVDDLACTLGVSRNSLNIVAASKGLIAGPIKLSMTDGSMVSYSSDHDTNDLIPPTSTIQQIDFAGTKWVLVIEKEATFRTLAASQYWSTCPNGQGIIITGKGYGDLTTRQFLHLIHDVRPLLPILCVVDCDPHGIDIMRNYKYGSKGLGHEERTRIPGLQWLGVKMDDILLGGRQHLDDSQGSTESHLEPRSQARGQRQITESLTALTSNDRKTAQRIFQAMLISERGGEDKELEEEELEQLRELQLMLMFNMKAEIQAIDHMGDLSDWLDIKMTVA